METGGYSEDRAGLRQWQPKAEELITVFPPQVFAREGNVPNIIIAVSTWPGTSGAPFLPARPFPASLLAHGSGIGQDQAGGLC